MTEAVAREGGPGDHPPGISSTRRLCALERGAETLDIHLARRGDDVILYRVLDGRRGYAGTQFWMDISPDATDVAGITAAANGYVVDQLAHAGWQAREGETRVHTDDVHRALAAVHPLRAIPARSLADVIFG